MTELLAKNKDKAGGPVVSLGTDSWAGRGTAHPGGSPSASPLKVLSPESQAFPPPNPNGAALGFALCSFRVDSTPLPSGPATLTDQTVRCVPGPEDTKQSKRSPSCQSFCDTSVICFHSNLAIIFFPLGFTCRIVVFCPLFRCRHLPQLVSGSFSSRSLGALSPDELL